MQRTLALVLTVAAGVALLCFALREAWITDDALISFRYLDNLTAGRGLVFNAGERVEGFSNPLFLLALLPLRLAHVDLWTAAIGLGIAFSLVELALIGWLTFRVTGAGLAAGLSVALFALDRVVQVWASGGLETAMHGALVFAALALTVRHLDDPPRGVRKVTALLVLVAASRPEGLLYYPLYLAFLYLRSPKSLVRSLNLFLPAIALLLAARFLYYGELTANPFRAKMTGVPTLGMGFGYLRAFALRMGWSTLFAIPWLALVVAAVRSLRKPPSGDGSEARPATIAIGLALACVAAQLAAGVAMGGDYLCDFRFYRPLLGPLYFAVACAAWLIARDTRPGATPVAGAIALALLGTHVIRQQQGSPMFSDAPPAPQHKLNVAVTRPQNERFRAALLAFAEEGDAQIADKSGVMGWGHAVRTVDCTGLLSKQIAGDFYLRDELAENGARERLPGHARWPRVDFMQRERFTFIFAKVNKLAPDVPEIAPHMPRRTREYPFLHVTIPLGGGEFFRFFTTLGEEEVRARAQRKHLPVCTRRPWGPLACDSG